MAFEEIPEVIGVTETGQKVFMNTDMMLMLERRFNSGASGSSRTLAAATEVNAAANAQEVIDRTAADAAIEAAYAAADAAVTAAFEAADVDIIAQIQAGGGGPALTAGTSFPSSPTAGDFHVLTSVAGENKLYQYQSSVWVNISDARIAVLQTELDTAEANITAVTATQASDNTARADEITALEAVNTANGFTGASNIASRMAAVDGGSAASSTIDQLEAENAAQDAVAASLDSRVASVETGKASVEVTDAIGAQLQGVAGDAGSNMVPNGDFLSNIEGWVGARGSAQTLSWSAGKLRLTGTGTTASFGASLELSGLEIGQAYTLSVDVDRGTVTGSFRIRTNQTDEQLLDSSGQTLVTVSGVTTHSFTATAETMWFGFILTPSAIGQYAEVDDISITKDLGLAARVTTVEAEATVLDARTTVVENTKAEATALDALSASFVSEQTELDAVQDALDASGNILLNGRLKQVGSDGRPAFIEVVEGRTNTVYLEALAGGGMRLTGSPDDSHAYGWPAFRVDEKYRYRIVIRHKSSAAGAAGLYLRLQELDADIGGDTHIGHSAAASGVDGVVQRDGFSDLVANGPMPGTSWVVDEYTYTPPAGVRWASFSVYNWFAFTGDYDVDYVVIIPEIAPVVERLTTAEADIVANAVVEASNNSARASEISALTTRVNDEEALSLLFREAISTDVASTARLLLEVATATNEATIVAAAGSGQGVWNGSAIRLTALLIQLVADAIDFGADTTFETVANTLYVTKNGNRLRILGPFGASSDVVFWYGPASIAVGAETKTNGYWAFGADDGKIYYGSDELQGDGILRAAIVSPSNVIGNGGGTASATVTTPSVTITPVGGDGNNTYSTVLVQGNGFSGFSVVNGATATPSFRATGMAVDEVRYATFRTTVTNTTTGDAVIVDSYANFLNFSEGGG